MEDALDSVSLSDAVPNEPALGGVTLGELRGTSGKFN